MAACRSTEDLVIYFHDRLTNAGRRLDDDDNDEDVDGGEEVDPERLRDLTDRVDSARQRLKELEDNVRTKDRAGHIR